MGLVTYIHTYIQPTYILVRRLLRWQERDLPAGWLAGWLAAFGEPAKRPRDLVHTSPVPPVPLSLSLPRSPHQISSFFPRWPCETVRAPGVGCTPPPPPWPIDDSLLGHYRSGE